jgi:hypothetical protein
MRLFPPNKRATWRENWSSTTPKHGSWLNSAEIERAILSNSCLSQRIPDKDTLRREGEANVRERNVKATSINWRFTTRDARLKLAQTVKNAT